MIDAILDALPVGVIVTDASGSVTAVNSQAKDIQSDYQTSALVMAAVRRAGEAVQGDSIYREALDFAGADSESFTITAHGLPDGGTVSVIEDVSQTRQVEAIRRDFVANVSHELRTPIGAIMVLTDSLETVSNDAAVEIRGHIVNEATRATQLLDELMDLSNLESTGAVGAEALNMNDVMNQVVAAVKATALAAKADVRLNVADDMNVVGVRKDLISAITNLVVNAIKYSGSSKIVDLELFEKNGSCVVSVTDYGIGIPQQDQERIFERFYRVDRSRNRSTGGNGLGLAIVRHVASNHNGYVSVVSREGEGSTFTLSLPLALEAS